MKNHHFYLLFGLGILLTGYSLSGCSTVVVEPAPLPEVPEYVKVPHPSGYDMVDVKAMLLSPMAPKGVLGEFADSCDEEFKKLAVTTNSKDDVKRGAEELVTHDPERTHWCFYSKLSRLQDYLTTDATWTSRQKKVLETYGFLTPIANAFVNVYQDTRYLRWATVYYTKISEWVFFRKVAPGPENTLMMVNTQRSDLEPWVPVKNTGQAVSNGSVFEKYGIALAPSTSKPVNPIAEEIPVAPEAAPAAPAVANAPTSAGAHDVAPPVSAINSDFGGAAQAAPAPREPASAAPTDEIIPMDKLPKN